MTHDPVEALIGFVVAAVLLAAFVGTIYLLEKATAVECPPGLSPVETTAGHVICVAGRKP